MLRRLRRRVGGRHPRELVSEIARVRRVGQLRDERSRHLASCHRFPIQVLDTEEIP